MVRELGGNRRRTFHLRIGRVERPTEHRGRAHRPRRRFRRRGHQRQRARSRCLGDRGNDRASHQVCQNRVTDDQGRYLIPDLPPANYNLWVRGYGLVDSPKVQATPGKILNLTAVMAPNAGAAAQYYPAIYWYSMLKIPAESQFSATQRDQNMPDNLKIQAQWVNIVKTTGCMSCHALGTIGTRTIPKELGEFSSSAEAWERRIQSGQAMTQMVNVIGRLDTQL